MLVTCYHGYARVALIMCNAAALALAVYDRGELVFILVVMI